MDKITKEEFLEQVAGGAVFSDDISGDTVYSCLMQTIAAHNEVSTKAIFMVYYRKLNQAQLLSVLEAFFNEFGYHMTIR